jgi:hypothetical protein
MRMPDGGSDAPHSPEAISARSSAVEQRPLTPKIVGSNPTAPAKKPKIDRGDKESYNNYMRNYMREYRRRQAEKREGK